MNSKVVYSGKNKPVGIEKVYSSPVSKYMVKKVITATVSQTLQSVCKTMYENDIGCLVIVKRKMDGLFPVGIITERDIVWIIGSTPPICGSGGHKRIYVISIGYS